MGVNLVGAKRAGLASSDIAALRQAFRILFFRRANLKVAMARVEQEVPLTPEVVHLLEFIRASTRGVAMGPKDRHNASSES
jgi:UDP-N-acetylglucosamine acyltransferase